jgi:hypothetical protein
MGYDIQRTGTQRRNEGVLHCWPGQLDRVGSDDSKRRDNHRRHSCVEMQVVPLVYVNPKLG